MAPSALRAPEPTASSRTITQRLLCAIAANIDGLIASFFLPEPAERR